MGDGEARSESSANSPEKVTIRIARTHGLHGMKGPHMISTVRVEFGASLLGESPKVESDHEESISDYGYSCHLVVTANEPSFLDELVHSPLVLTFTEILPKDKKAREEKTHVLGQACIDLLPLIKGEVSFSLTQPIYATADIVPSGGTDTPSSVSTTVGDVQLTISTTNPVLSQDCMESSNMMTACVESMFSVPESLVSNANLYTYSAGLSVPIAEQKEVTAILPNGMFRAANEKNVPNQRKWASAPTASGPCLFIPDSCIAKRVIENEDGGLKSKEDIPFRMEAENERPRVVWNTERRFFLSDAGAQSLQVKIAQYRVWSIEVARMTIPTIGKGKGKPEDDISLSYHGVAYVDFSPLLYPGVQCIRGAYPVVPFSESELASKGNRKAVLTEESSKAVGGMSRTLGSSLGPAKQQVSKLGKMEVKQKSSGAVLKPSEPGAETDAADSKSTDAQQYVESRTYITLEIMLDRPLVPRKKPEVLAQRVAEIIPARPKFPKKVGGAKKAIHDFEVQIGRTAAQLLEEFRIMFGKDIGDEDGISMEERRKKFMFELNSSGKYFAFKEQIKYYIIKLVREKFMNTTGFQSQEEMQAFISELYEFLLDQMHSGLNKFLDAEETVEIPPPVTDGAMLKHFAKEAEVDFNYEVAARYYQERIARWKNDADCWLDYGIFCLLIDDMAKAQECIKEAVAIDQKHTSGLILNGCLEIMQDKHESAEVLLEAATMVEENSIVAWTVLGMYYAGVDNDIMSERAFNEAERLHRTKTGQEMVQTKSYVQLDKAEALEPARLSCIDERTELDSSSKEGAEGANTAKGTGSDRRAQSAASTPGKTAEQGKQESKPKECHTCVKDQQPLSIYMQAAEFLLDCHILQMAERALALELLTSGGKQSSSYLQLYARFKMEKKEYDAAKEAVQKALMLKHENADGWAFMGHIHFLSGEYQKAKECFERSLAYVEDASNQHSVYMRLAKIYWLDQEYLKARRTYLRACSSSPSCITWLGVGKASYMLNDLAEAEYALKEANTLDNRNAEVWAFLTLVCLKSMRHLEAEQAYKYAVKVGIEDTDLLAEIKHTMTEVRFDTSVL